MAVCWQWRLGMSQEIEQLVAELQQHVKNTASRYGGIHKRGVLTHPIPFFGDLATASVVTVGVNPSATEFNTGRWPSALAPAELTERLLRYFQREPHPWFERWETALRTIGVSYRQDAAHVDISPRATVSEAVRVDPRAWEQMLTDDLPWMVRFIAAAPRVRLIMMAGAATSALYVNEFVAKKLPLELARLEGSLSRPAGRAKVRHHEIVIGTRRIPVWFCSSSPSDRSNPELLLGRVREHATALQAHLRA
jgi:hypothetical protein